jgi:hypothetical protein
MPKSPTYRPLHQKRSARAQPLRIPR